MIYSEIRRGYLPVLRALKRTCHNDIDAERQIIGAIRVSIAEMLNAQVPTNDILSELDMTRQMLLQNIAQVSFNDNIDTYSVKLREEMLPKDGVTLDLKTPGDLLKEQECNVDHFVSKHSNYSTH
jgi:hypothetical protein